MHFLLLSLAVLLQLSAGELQGVKFAAKAATSADQINIILDKHNQIRREVQPTAKNMQKLAWNGKAAKNAQSWAEKCVFKHSPPAARTVDGIGCGENIFMSTAFTSWPNVIQSWADEKKNFKYGTGPKFPGAVIGHYTQLIWAKTVQLGCGSAKCSGFYLNVCQYCPAGNILGQMATPYAAGSSCGDCPRACSDKLCIKPFRSNVAYMQQGSNMYTCGLGRNGFDTVVHTTLSQVPILEDIWIGAPTARALRGHGNVGMMSGQRESVLLLASAPLLDHSKISLVKVLFFTEELHIFVQIMTPFSTCWMKRSNLNL
ncbi:cysteine-rich venom protein-like [Tiliqua scincoides]|uniref:cysteine-rich venom protein-like n=1 Tax=Tiliqua scincoides TaxID=71010 RepID=UPI0034624D91